MSKFFGLQKDILIPWALSLALSPWFFASLNASESSPSWRAHPWDWLLRESCSNWAHQLQRIEDTLFVSHIQSLWRSPEERQKVCTLSANDLRRMQNRPSISSAENSESCLDNNIVVDLSNEDGGGYVNSDHPNHIWFLPIETLIEANLHPSRNLHFSGHLIIYATPSFDVDNSAFANGAANELSRYNGLLAISSSGYLIFCNEHSALDNLSLRLSAPKIVVSQNSSALRDQIQILDEGSLLTVYIIEETRKLLKSHIPDWLY